MSSLCVHHELMVHIHRAVHNFFYLGGGKLLAEVQNMAALQYVLHSGRVWGDAPPRNLGVLGRILVHSEAYRETHRAS